jgi:DNA-binding response OmpR family regulator
MTAHARILLAEDDEISQAIIQHILAGLDHVDLTIVSDGREALLACMASKFDLLIIDRKMPLISGDRLIRQLRTSGNLNSETPIILFSASTASELKDMGVTCPADLLLSKPLNVGEFLASVKAFIALGPNTPVPD